MARSRTYTNRRGGVTEETRVNTRRGGDAIIRQNLSDDKYDKFKAYRATKSHENNGIARYVSNRNGLLPGESDTLSGHVSARKTPEMIQAQLERIKQNASFLMARERSNDAEEDRRRDLIYDRYNRAAAAANAYADYHALGATAG